MDTLVKNKIYLNNLENQLSEDVYSQFSAQVFDALMQLYGAGMGTPFSLIGTNPQIAAFSQSLAQEKEYIDAITNYGVNDSRTLALRPAMADSVTNFEKETGLRWPFKN